MENEVRTMQQELVAVQKERQHLEHHRKMLCMAPPCPPQPCPPPPCSAPPCPPPCHPPPMVKQFLYIYEPPVLNRSSFCCFCFSVLFSLCRYNFFYFLIIITLLNN